MISVRNVVGTLALTTGISMVPITYESVKNDFPRPYIRIMNENENYNFYKDIVLSHVENNENEDGDLKITGKIPVILSKNNRVPFQWV